MVLAPEQGGTLGQELRAKGDNDKAVALSVSGTRKPLESSKGQCWQEISLEKNEEGSHHHGLN